MLKSTQWMGAWMRFMGVDSPGTIKGIDLMGLQDKMPRLKFREDWEVETSFPYPFATVRLYIHSGDKYISLYVDHFNALGAMGEPYIEMYAPDDWEDPERYLLSDPDYQKKIFDRMTAYFDDELDI